MAVLLAQTALAGTHDVGSGTFEAPEDFRLPAHGHKGFLHGHTDSKERWIYHHFRRGRLWLQRVSPSI